MAEWEVQGVKRLAEAEHLDGLVTCLFVREWGEFGVGVFFLGRRADLENRFACSRLSSKKKAKQY